MPPCTNSLMYKIWNGKEVKWWDLDSEGFSGAMLELWDKSKFNVHIVEYVSGWIALIFSQQQNYRRDLILLL
ncbi:hypothetical protein NC651_037380 [Populus alba x Populus x berolinensis]|nr:hypothetical protein NC651_037380 [Populus alba x Populus x berolinensis]